MLVGAVIADADNEEQIFLHEKYRLNWSFVKIGMELHIHPNGLQRWWDKFLAEIAALLEYNLPPADIFSRNTRHRFMFWNVPLLFTKNLETSMKKFWRN